jgi:hypothetical protein
MNLLKTIGALFIALMVLYVIVTLVGVLAATIATLVYLAVIVGLIAVAVLVYRHQKEQGRR